VISYDIGLNQGGAMLEQLFQLKKRKASIVTEVLAGVIVFFSMIYILPVNASIFASIGMNQQGVFIATALVAGLISIVMGIYANYPVALASGMGMNAYVAYTVIGGLGYAWQEAFALLFVSGIFFFLMSLTSLRRTIINAIPQDIKAILGAGLGAFIAFVGLRNANVIVAGPTLVTLASLSSPAVLLALAGIFIAFLFFSIPNARINQLAILLAMIVTAFLAILLTQLGVNFEGLPNLNLNFGNPFEGYADVAFQIFGSNEQGTPYLLAVLVRPETYAIIFSLTMVNVFDTTATLVAIGKGAGLLNEKQELIGNEAIIADAVGALICAPLGTSTVTSYAESTIGVQSGAKTGLTAVTVGLLFILSIFLFPIFTIFTYAPVTAMALVSVGALMFMNNLKEIRWNDITIAFTAFVTIIFMILTYSITSGLGIGILLYIVMMFGSKRLKQVNPVLLGIGLLFLMSFLVSEIVTLL
jgi:AGZA family xanthine/uracil permease-like MFS transporter